MKFLIAGLGNTGAEYLNTRHNIGFLIADALAASGQAAFAPGRLADVADMKVRGKRVLVIKPTTYMNLSGKAVHYWLQAGKIPVSRLLVLTDDIALPFGTIRIRAGGSDGGHNGLAHLVETLATTAFARLRFGIGNDFPRGGQVDYVLSEWSADEWKRLPERIDTCVEAVRLFLHAGLAETMNRYNNK